MAGGEGADIVQGDAGNDTLAGGTGADTLTGGAGADVFRYNPGNPATESSGLTMDEIVNFSQGQGDLIDLGTASTYFGTFGDAPIVFAGNLIGFSGTPGEAIPDFNGIGASLTQLYYANLGSSGLLLADLNHNGKYDSTDFAVRFTGSMPASWTTVDFLPGSFQALVGTDGDDPAGYFATNGAADLVFGVDGNETILGLDGRDYVYGGAQHVADAAVEPFHHSVGLGRLRRRQAVLDAQFGAEQVELVLAGRGPRP